MRKSAVARAKPALIVAVLFAPPLSPFALFPLGPTNRRQISVFFFSFFQLSLSRVPLTSADTDVHGAEASREIEQRGSYVPPPSESRLVSWQPLQITPPSSVNQSGGERRWANIRDGFKMLQNTRLVWFKGVNGITAPPAAAEGTAGEE